MPYRTYVEKNFGAKALLTIQRANAIAQQYAAQGYDLTLRQLYYQFVSRDWIPNKDTEYKNLGGVLNDARLAGLVDWNHIVDRTRNLEDLAHWESPDSIVAAIAEQYREAKWAKQPYHVEVWIEKDALKGILEQACEPLDVPYFSCRGYTSQSEIWGAAQRLGKKIRKDQKVRIIHLGDHDPSGIDMTRDIEDRLRMFIAQDVFDQPEMPVRDESSDGGFDKWEVKENWQYATEDHIEIERIALNLDQVRQYNPPPNPAKLTDVRARKYIQRYGAQSWELDALDPNTLTNLIQNAILEYRDEDIWAESAAKEDKGKTLLDLASRNWAEVVEWMEANVA